MPRPERPIDPSAGPRESFAYELRQLRRVAGNLSYEKLAKLSHYSRTALSEAAGGRTFPSWEVTRAFVRACGGDLKQWTNRWAATERALSKAAETPNGDRPAPVIVDRPRPRRRWVMIMVSTAVAIASAGAGVLVRSSFAGTGTSMSHSIFLGDIDLGQFCRAQGYSGVSLDGATAADWHCFRPPETRDSLSVNEACRQQYQRPGALARYADTLNPYSWQCWDGVLVVGRIDIDRYCRGHGYSSTQLEPTGTDTWDCVGANGAKLTIDHDSACRWQFGTRVVVAGPGPFHSPWEHWDCWG
jgi:Helix-turn-helix domain